LPSGQKLARRTFDDARREESREFLVGGGNLSTIPMRRPAISLLEVSGANLTPEEMKTIQSPRSYRCPAQLPPKKPKKTGHDHSAAGCQVEKRGPFASGQARSGSGHCGADFLYGAPNCMIQKDGASFS